MDEGTVQAITESAQSQLDNAKLYTMIERYKVEKIFEEQRLQYQGNVDESTAIKIGKMLSAAKLVIGSVNRMGGSVVISARIVDVETGEIEMSATETGKESRIQESVRKLVRRLIDKDRTDFQSYLRSREFDNSIIAGGGYSLFYGSMVNKTNGSKDFFLSYRRKGIPFLTTNNWYTEFELGRFSPVYYDSDKRWPLVYLHREVDYTPCSLNLQYYLPVSIFSDIYLKVGAGAAQVVCKNYVAYSGTYLNDDTSMEPFCRAGIGFDLARDTVIGLRLELLFNRYYSNDHEPSGITGNAGLSFNW